MNSQFYGSLHGLRGIAATLVLIGHSLGGFIENTCESCDSEFTQALYAICTFGVEIFFTLSGFVIYLACKRADSSSKFFQHRFWRIYPVFILFTIIYYCLNHFLQIDPNRDSTWYLLSNILFLNTFLKTLPLTPNAWTITYEIWYYIATFCIVSSLIFRKNYALIPLGGIVTIYFLLVYPVSFYYLAGVILAIYNRQIISIIERFSSKAISSIHIVILSALIYLASTEHQYKWEAIAGAPGTVMGLIALSMFIALSLTNRSIITRALNQKIILSLGTVSYSLYLAHPYSYLAARKITEYTALPSGSMPLTIFIFVLLNIIFTVGLVILVHKYVEQFFYTKFTGKPIYKNA